MFTGNHENKVKVEKRQCTNTATQYGLRFKMSTNLYPVSSKAFSYLKFYGYNLENKNKISKILHVAELQHIGEQLCQWCQNEIGRDRPKERREKW